MTTLSHKFININLNNEHIDYLAFGTLYTNIDTKQNLSSTSYDNKINNLDLSEDDIQIFISFIENIIACDSFHQGCIYPCIRGTYNKNVLFFNIAGNYRYCSKNGHHQRHTVAIMTNTKNYT